MCRISRQKNNHPLSSCLHRHHRIRQPLDESRALLGQLLLHHNPSLATSLQLTPRHHMVRLPHCLWYAAPPIFLLFLPSSYPYLLPPRNNKPYYGISTSTPVPSNEPAAVVPLPSIRASLFNSTLSDSSPYDPPRDPGLSKHRVSEPIQPTPSTHPCLEALRLSRLNLPLPENTLISLSLEGGGMRGSVSAGMASALSLLDLGKHFDR